MSHDLLVQIAYVRLHDIQKKNCFAPGADNLEQATPQFCSGGSRRRGGGGSHLDSEIRGTQAQKNLV